MKEHHLLKRWQIFFFRNNHNNFEDQYDDKNYEIVINDEYSSYDESGTSEYYEDSDYSENDENDESDESENTEMNNSFNSDKSYPW